MYKVMALDVGTKRIGIALSDFLLMLANGHSYIPREPEDKAIEAIYKIAKENRVEKIVVGVPLNMDGSEGESALSAREFSEILSTRTQAEVLLQDERSTTVSAHGYLNVTDTRGKKRKAVVDAVAATIILQDYLDFRRNNK